MCEVRWTGLVNEKFTAEYASERVLKIRQCLVNIHVTTLCHHIYGSSCNNKSHITSSLNLEILVNGVHKHKEDVGTISDVDVCRRLAQFDTGDRGTLGQCSAVAVVL